MTPRRALIQTIVERMSAGCRRWPAGTDMDKVDFRALPPLRVIPTTREALERLFGDVVGCVAEGSENARLLDHEERTIKTWVRFRGEVLAAFREYTS